MICCLEDHPLQERSASDVVDETHTLAGAPYAPSASPFASLAPALAHHQVLDVAKLEGRALVRLDALDLLCHLVAERPCGVVQLAEHEDGGRLIGRDGALLGSPGQLLRLRTRTECHS